MFVFIAHPPHTEYYTPGYSSKKNVKEFNPAVNSGVFAAPEGLSEFLR